MYAKKKLVPAKRRLFAESLEAIDKLAIERRRRDGGTVRLGLLLQCSGAPS